MPTVPSSQRRTPRHTSGRATQNAGFTLFELLLTISLLAALTGGVAFATNEFRESHDLRLATTIVEHSVRSAKLYAHSGKNDAAWGVKILPDGATVFRGDSYAGRIASADESIPFPSSITISGIEELVFSRLSDTPNPVGSIMLTNASGNTVLTVNTHGIVAP
jgi:prepilin-type N-terminal cleavage/methylation domain-containing protein